MKIKRLVAMFVVIASATSMIGCKTESNRKYVCSDNKESIIVINKSSTDDAGTGKVTKGWEPGNRVYTITGNFKYGKDRVTMLSGAFRGQEFTDIDITKNAEKIKFNGK